MPGKAAHIPLHEGHRPTASIQLRYDGRILAGHRKPCSGAVRTGELVDRVGSVKSQPHAGFSVTSAKRRDPADLFFSRIQSLPPRASLPHWPQCLNERFQLTSLGAQAILLMRRLPALSAALSRGHVERLAYHAFPSATLRVPGYPGASFSACGNASSQRASGCERPGVNRFGAPLKGAKRNV